MMITEEDESDEPEMMVETSEDEEDAAIGQIWDELLREEEALKERSRCRHIFEPSDFVVASFLSAANAVKRNPAGGSQQCVGTILSFLENGWRMDLSWCMPPTGLLQDHTTTSLLDVVHAMEASEALAESCRNQFEQVCSVLCAATLTHGEGDATTCHCLRCLETCLRSLANSSAREILGVAICSTLQLLLQQGVSGRGEVTMWGPYANACSLLEPLKEITRTQSGDTIPEPMKCEVNEHLQHLLGSVRKLPVATTGQPHLAGLRMYLWHIAAAAQ